MYYGNKHGEQHQQASGSSPRVDQYQGSKLSPHKIVGQMFGCGNPPYGQGKGPPPNAESYLHGPDNRVARHHMQLILSECPDIYRIPLADQAEYMHGPIRTWLINLGRPPTEVGARSDHRITLPQTAEQLPRAQSCNIGIFPLSTDEVRHLSRTAFRTAVSTRDGEASRWNESSMQLHAITGTVYNMYRNDLQMNGDRSPYGITCVSIPGINFAYSDADRSRFVRNGKIDTKPTLHRMKLIWGHTLHNMLTKSVRVPVLSAIGCGAFKGDFKEVPTLWAEALASILSSTSNSVAKFDLVVLCLPTFGPSTNFRDFHTVFKKKAGQLQCPVLLLHNKSMLIVGDLLTRHAIRTGILNPSDWEALAKGKIGMYWDGGHIALEEIMAMQTTLLVQHKAFSPQLFDQRKTYQVSEDQIL